jgi:uncharacterized protein YecE (DUF72 family)
VIWVGTSGFQYPEWKGSFYPAKLPTKQMLGYYGERFNTTEINYTFRRMPTETILANWSAQTPSQFRFSLKAPQVITHIRQLRDCETIVQRFADVSQALGEKLGAILFQLPPSLQADVPLLAEFLAVLPPGMKAAFEFRHDSWFNDETFNALRKHGAALCVADSEKRHSPVVTTAGFAYFRLRDEGYETSDIARWAKEIRKASTETTDVYVYFKHEEKGLGPEFARELLRNLER